MEPLTCPSGPCALPMPTKPSEAHPPDQNVQNNAITNNNTTTRDWRVGKQTPAAEELTMGTLGKIRWKRVSNMSNTITVPAHNAPSLSPTPK